MTEIFQVRTAATSDLIDVTHSVQKAVDRTGVKEGICFVFIPHTTAAVTINENADPAVSEDLLVALDRIVPVDGRYRHLEGNAPAHIKSSLVGSSQVVFVESGKLMLGTWQSIFLCEFDGPRTRKVYVKVMSQEG